jgi:hypothetical protein
VRGDTFDENASEMRINQFATLAQHGLRRFRQTLTEIPHQTSVNINDRYQIPTRRLRMHRQCGQRSAHVPDGTRGRPTWFQSRTGSLGITFGRLPTRASRVTVGELLFALMQADMIRRRDRVSLVVVRADQEPIGRMR